MIDREISRMVVDGTPSASVSRRMRLSATMSPLALSLAFYPDWPFYAQIKTISNLKNVLVN
ncbi:hypothetical protein BpHYR1_010366 [Brachionus plicatilis]|uniref:Uncharacterized protein n=1 Tax=Brachionus plicatilis TaxID=10195 RepID=A0A3M7RJ15_BRAPC|nr:hypothetical protein BpHYR1_010366 [Brachionus plicatilis]